MAGPGGIYGGPYRTAPDKPQQKLKRPLYRWEVTTPCGIETVSSCYCIIDHGVLMFKDSYDKDGEEGIRIIRAFAATAWLEFKEM